MPNFSAEERVRLVAFSRQTEGDEVVIGRPETGIFLALPREAVALLDELAAGRTIREVQEDFRRQYGETPDIDGLLTELEPLGFLVAKKVADHEAKPGARQPTRFHFARFPQTLAALIFGRPALLIVGLTIALAIAAAVAEPALRPTWKALFFERNATLMTSLLMLSGFALTFFHEMGHLIAARARGIFCTLGISNRMWVLVAETDMTGVWSLPRRERYLPILAGPLVDAFSGASVILILFGQLHGFFELPAGVARFLQALAMAYLLKIAWQFYFFVRTDFYYVYTMAFGCKNLMKDTQDFLRNRLARLRRRKPPADQSHIPRREMIAIRAYSGFWLTGRILALTIFFTVILPVLLSYLAAFAVILIDPGNASAHQTLETGAFGLVSLGVLLAGIFLWLKGIYQNRRLQNGMALDSPSKL